MAEIRNYQARAAAGTPTDVAIDEGLRAYMIKVYNLMALGLAITGVAAALRLADAERVVVLPTDMPFVTVELLLALAEASEGAEAAVPHSGPLPGAYASSALPVLEEHIASGDLALYRACVRLEPRVLQWDEAELANINEPGDLRGE